MAPAQAKVVARDVREQLVLYTPVVHRGDFDAAVSYLVRRLEENASPENYLYALFSDAGPASYTDRFRASVRDRDAVPATPRRSAHVSDPGRQDDPNHSRAEHRFGNDPDTDPSLAANRDVGAAGDRRPGARGARARADRPGRRRRRRRPGASPPRGATAPARERAAVLREAARALAAARGDLLTVMVDEAGKTIAEADPEISEAIDFAAYYADRADELEGAPFTPDRVVVVTPPWNFPIAIPLGGCVAALAAGASVVIKPAPQVRACAEVGVAALHRGGIPADALQLVHTDEGDAGPAARDAPGRRPRRAHRGVADRRAVPVVAPRPAAGRRDERQERAGRHTERRPGPRRRRPRALGLRARRARSARRRRWRSWSGRCARRAPPPGRGSTASSSTPSAPCASATGSDPSTTMGPLIGPPDEKLERALTRLDRGETMARGAPAARHDAVDARGEGAGGARLVVPPHRVLRAGAGTHARGRPRRGDRAAERHRLRPDRRPARTRPGRDRPLERARRGRQRLRQPPHHRRHRAAPVVRGLEGLRGRTGRQAGRPELRRPVRDVARRDPRRSPLGPAPAAGRGTARRRGPALGCRGPRLAARRRRVGRRRLARRVLRRARPDGPARRGQRLPLPPAARAADRGRRGRRGARRAAGAPRGGVRRGAGDGVLGVAGAR